jgi:asparagine synthetase B (glutamine-hydrolysing)
MCGIFGVIIGNKSLLTKEEIKIAVRHLFLLSESRGKEASGIAALCQEIEVMKSAEAASKLVADPVFKIILNKALDDHPVYIMGHSRLVTNGGHQKHENNQPAVAGDLVAIHNGIVTNVDELWLKYPHLERQTELDTEVILRLMRENISKEYDPVTSLQRVYAEIEGVASMALLFADRNVAMLSTNNGSLYYAVDGGEDLIFASERFILQKLFHVPQLQRKLKTWQIHPLTAGSGLLVDLTDLHHHLFSLRSEISFKPEMLPHKPRKILDLSSNHTNQRIERTLGEGPYILPVGFKDEYPENHDAVAKLRRCTRCVLPETMPFIDFDEEGVCNYCRTHEPLDYLGLDALRAKLEPYRKTNHEPDCLVTFSGGRDSSYGVHILKTVLDMHPVTYTYDWGMVTDLARRNQMRICGQLGIEHILVSANLAQKRANIRKNVSAWLRKPDLGVVPLFMAGDKQYFYYANKVNRQVGTRIVVVCENRMEITYFKGGFCGVIPNLKSKRAYSLSLANKFRLARHYSMQYINNPAYLNSSLLDTLGAYLSYYFIPHNYLNIYDYIPWNEKEIIDVLKSEYRWETAPDTQSTWRIGDGTAAFYNYIYYTLAGLTENDTFRSYLIREGLLTRDEALRLVEQDNQPRYQSIQWYCDIIGIDFEYTIKVINAAPKLYQDQ